MLLYAIIFHMDEQIGRIIDKLESEGKLENTIFVFMADHGLAVGQHGLMGKQNIYDHSLRVPFIISGPGIPANETREAQSICKILPSIRMYRKGERHYGDWIKMLPVPELPATYWRTASTQQCGLMAV